MKTKILPLFLVISMVFTVAVSGCIQSDSSNINGLSSSINADLKKGDDFYNKAVLDSNKYSLDNASSNSNSALSAFNSAKNSAQQASNYAQSSNDSVLIEYMQNTVGEIDSRINATLELQQAISYFEQKDSENGNSHVLLANQYMDEAIQYKAKNDNIVEQNPSKFK
jgi:hypothetical protein